MHKGRRDQDPRAKMSREEEEAVWNGEFGEAAGDDRERAC